MKLYHGSFTAIAAPNLSFSRDTTDFGKGFYTTTIQYCFITQTVMDKYLTYKGNTAV